MRIVAQLPIALLALNVGVWFAPGRVVAEKQAPQGYIVSLPAETAADRQARHKKIAERRRGPVIIVHRGASAVAPENTLEAYAAAMDYGADGCEIDIRRTADGILVILHDDGLDRMTDALGPLDQYAYRELAALSFRSRYNARPRTGIPTLAAVLELARKRAMLLHLDIKEPGLEADIGRLLDVADIWDHIVEINQYNSAELRRNPKFQPLAYKAPGLQEGRLDLDPDKVREALAKPGKMIMVDDPRVAAHELKRASRRVPLPDELRAPLPETPALLRPETNAFSPARFLQALSLRVNQDLPAELEKLLEAPFPEQGDLEGDAVRQQRRAARILERAWAAQRLGRLGTKSTRAVNLLEQVVENRSLHHDWAYLGLDGVMAARALGRLHAVEAVPVLVRAFRKVDPALERLVQPPAPYPYAWGDFHIKSEIIATLGELRCRESRSFLLHYVALDEKGVAVFAPPLFEEATSALLKQELTPPELQGLLRSTNTAVRGTVIIECWKHPTVERAVALRTVLPWTQDLPRSWRLYKGSRVSDGE